MLLIDEFDKIAGRNDSFYIEMNDKAMKVLLQELDDLKDNSGVLVVATCNDFRSLGPALVRSGRFDRIFQINPPSLEDRRKILEMYYSRLKLKIDFDIDYIARITTGFSGAMIETLVNESGIIAIEKDLDRINFECVQSAINRRAFHSIEGEIKESEKHLIAVHEAGHALVALCLKPESLSNASIIPIGDSKGHTRIMEDDEMFFAKKGKDFSDIMIALGGRIAEIIEFGESSCGCADDIDKAINMLDYLIVRCGLFGYEYVSASMRGINSSKQSDKVVEKRIEVLKELDEKVKSIIKEHKETFNKIVKGLEDKHVLSREELLACAE